MPVLHDLSRVDYNGVVKDTVVLSKRIDNKHKTYFKDGIENKEYFQPIEDGDFVYLGNFPKSAILESVKILVHEPFDEGVVLDLGHSVTYSYSVLNEIKSGIVIDKPVSVIDVDMVVDDGVVKDDGVTPADKGSVWVGGNVYLFGKLSGATITKGSIEVIMTLSQFDANGKLDNIS